MSALVLHPEGDKARVVDPSAFLEWLTGVEHDGAVACDTETAGLGWSDDVRLVQFGDANDGYAICVDPKLDNQAKDGQALVRFAIKEWKGALIFHNAAFDVNALRRSCGVDPDYVWPRAINTHVMAHVMDPGAMSKKLKDLCVKHLGPEADRLQKGLKQFLDGKEPVWEEDGITPVLDSKGKQKMKKVKGRRTWGWHNVPLLKLAAYGVQDTVLTHNLWTFIQERLSEVEQEVVNKEYEAAIAVYEVELKGMRLDERYAANLQLEWQEFLDKERAWFLAEYAIENPNADAQLINVLMDLGWKPTKYADKGKFNRVTYSKMTGEPKVTSQKKPTLDKKVIKALAAEGSDLCVHLLEYKRINKWKAAYTDNCIEQVDAEGRVHARYNVLGAKTSRMSCSNPPLQQLPKGGGGEVRSMFIASEGHVIASVDYSAIELRLAGALANEPNIIDAYANGIDLYQQTADAIGCDRPAAKIVVLATLYGAGGKTIAKGLGVDPSEGMRLHTAFWDTYPTLSRWNVSMTNKARGGQVKSMWGRTLAPHMPYAAANAVIQGTAAEVMKGGLLRMAEKGLLRYVCAIVHDEVVGDVPEAEAEAWVKATQAALADNSFIIPITAEGEVYGRSWGDGYLADASPTIEEIEDE